MGLLCKFGTMSPKLSIGFAVFCILSSVIVAKKDHDYQDPYDYEEDYGNDESGDGGNKCPIIDLPPGLGGRCDVSDLCSKITCDVKVQGRHATIVFKVNRCKDPLTATVTFKSPGFVVDWSHTFKDGEVIKLPEDHTITEGLNSLAKVSVSLKVGLKRNGEKLHFKLELMGNANIPLLHSKDHPFDANLLEGEIPLSSKYCGFSAWYNRQPRYIKMLTIAGPILGFIFLFILTICCGMWCKRRAPARLQVNLPTHKPQILSTQSKVPMQQLVNEA